MKLKNKKYINIFFDTEFSTAGMNSELISLGMISENNDKLYIEFHYNKKFLTSWLKENVINKLNKTKFTKNNAKKKIEKWMKKVGEGKKIRLISAGKEMDNLLFYSLWTSKNKNEPYCWRYRIPDQINHTSHIDMMTLLQINKLDTTIDRLKFSGLKKIVAHHSLNDAIVLKKCYEKLKIKC